MAIGRAKAGQLRVAVESAFGTAGTYYCTRPEALPNFPASQTLVANHVGGHQHPLTMEKPEKVNILRESAFSADFRIRRATSDGATPDIVKFFESAGWNAAVSSGATTLTGTPTVSELVQASNVTGAGQFVLVNVGGVYTPVLVSSLSTATITPHVRMVTVPSTGAAVELMHTLTPATSTSYATPSDKTLSFKLNTQGQYDDALGDLTLGLTGCALANIGEITFGRVGTFPTLSCTFHGTPSAPAAEDIAADSFTDSERFAIMTSDAQFSIQSASASGDIAVVRGAIVEAKINPGINVVPVYNTGNTNVGGASGYMNLQTAPTCTVTAQFYKSAMSKTFLTELEGSNASYCIQLVQPTRDLNQPAFAVCMPNCHTMEGGEPMVDVTGDIIQITNTFVASTAGIDSDTLISEVGSQPIFIGVSGEAA